MLEQNRRQYLKAMGIDVWSLRVDTGGEDSLVVASSDRAALTAREIHSTTEPYQLSTSELEKWLAEQCLLKIRSGDVSVNTLGKPDAELLVLSQCLIKDKLTHQPFSGKSGVLLRAMLRELDEDFSTVLLGELDTPQNQGKSLTALLQGKKVRVILLLVDLPSQHPHSELDKFRSQCLWLEQPRTQVVVSFHPEYLLTNPQVKAQAWRDLKRVHKLIMGA